MQIVTAVKRPLSADWRLEPFKQEGNEEVSISRCRAQTLREFFFHEKKATKYRMFCVTQILNLIILNLKKT